MKKLMPTKEINSEHKRRIMKLEEDLRQAELEESLTMKR
jgi:hypothetical protein